MLFEHLKKPTSSFDLRPAINKPFQKGVQLKSSLIISYLGRMNRSPVQRKARSQRYLPNKQPL
jgi:hypothetical protein